MRMHRVRLPLSLVGLAAVVLVLPLATGLRAQKGTGASGEWREYGGDQGYTKYSPLDLINRDTVSKLQVAWRRPAVADEIRAKNPKLTVSNNLRSTPIMVGGVMYVSNGIGLVEAFDPATGKTLWIQETDGPQDVMGGGSARRIVHWGSGDEARILSVRGEYLYAMRAKDGTLIRSFGENGRGHVRQGMLEGSNVSIVEELVDMIETQRAYEINSKAISAVDGMLKFLNQNI